MSHNIKSFKEFLAESNSNIEELNALNENLKKELTPEEKAKIDAAVRAFTEEYMKDKNGIIDFNNELTNEGIFGSLLGGLTGYALGETVSKIICNVLGIKDGLLYNLLTSKFVTSALGAALGSKLKI